MRTLLVLILLANTLLAQPPASPEALNLGQAIGVGAVKSVADLEARIDLLIKLVPPYEATWSWPGSTTPERMERLREHFKTEPKHAGRDVSKWSTVELAFTHDCDHVDEYIRDGKALPVLKDQRLRDWLRAKSPAKALARKLGWTVKRIVMHTMNGCSRCDDWKRDEQPQAEADGVTVEVTNEGRGIPGNSYPYFDVQYCNGDACRNLRFGFIRYQTMKTAL